MPESQRELFAGAAAGPPGFEYVPGFLSAAEADALLQAIGCMPLAAARYREFTARRRVAYFGGEYDFSHQALNPAPPIPPVLEPLRARVAGFAGIEPSRFTHALIAEYSPGAPLGWHRDIPDFELVAGISLGTPARMQFRPYPPAPSDRRQYLNVWLEPNSLYLMRGPARWQWQHRIPEVKTLRYSITFRTLREGRSQAGTPTQADA